ncbi:MAG: aldehyde dehydrogenase family protein [Deltaproteobacteria bacterium]|nr:aldehyde dehydrogenase family protein [Deltaproteobacteria bacterium]
MSNMEIQERLEILAQVAERLERWRDDLVAAEAEDIGAPYQIGHIELDIGIDHLGSMAVEVPHVAGKAPYGTVAAIFPYDAPVVMLARVGGAAVLGGNRFRFSFSSQTPRTARVIAEVVRPFPIFEPVVGQANPQFGRQCIADPQVRVFFISGGSEVGTIYEQAAVNFDKLFFAGPGGMPAAVLLADTSITAAARYLVRRAFINGGQYCTTIKKAYIHSEIYEQVKSAVLTQLAEIKVGEVHDPDVWIGPIRVERTRRLLSESLEAIPRPRYLVPPRLEGKWIWPLLVEVKEVPDLVMFGPFLALIRVKDDAEAIERVQQTEYPFAVSIFGTPTAEAREQLEQTFGMVYENPNFTFTPLRLPFGGKKQSGWILENKDGSLQRRDGAFIYSAELVQG